MCFYFFSKSQVSNIIYLDSPTGVGYSYSKNTSDYNTGDLKTATEAHKFLLKWFDIYKEYVANPFFIAGESYAGIYVPTLASAVMKGLDAGVKPVINLKGYMVGNGVTDEAYDGNALVPFAHGMGLISNELYQVQAGLPERNGLRWVGLTSMEIMTECEGNYYNPASEGCDRLLSKVNKVLTLHNAGNSLIENGSKHYFLTYALIIYIKLQDVDGLNIYDILEPCYHTPDAGKKNTNLRLPSSFKTLGGTERPLPVRKRIYGRAWPLRAPVRDGIVPTWPEIANSLSVPCIESVSGRWELCTARISYNHDAGSMIKYHKDLTSRGYRALIYSGDHDMCVPYTGSEAWTKSVGYKVVDEWRPWVCNEQVSGFTQGYEKNLTFLTIKGAGHTVPEYKPREALYFYSQFLAREKI
ncbi:Serine carboxypeptidase 1 [Bienertia sinuspersici]